MASDQFTKPPSESRTKAKAFLLSLQDEICTGLEQIDGEGKLFLPEVGFAFAEGKTLSELNDFLVEEYQKYIFDPILEISLIAYKPLKIYLGGEIKQPGLYKLDFENPNIFPKLFNL